MSGPVRPDHDALVSADRAHLWHPFTQQRDWADEQPVIVERADGTDLVDTEGNRYIDGVSSLWCNVHGHRQPQIDAAIRDQLDRVAHSTMLGLSHPGAIELARRLVEIAPPGLTRVFYSDSGSTAAEIALKMAFQFWAQRGEDRRTRFVSLRELDRGRVGEAEHRRVRDPAELGPDRGVDARVAVPVDVAPER